MLRPRQDIDEFIADVQRTKKSKRPSTRSSGGKSRTVAKEIRYLEGSSDLASVTQMQRPASVAPSPPAPTKARPSALRKNSRKLPPRNLSLALAEESASVQSRARAPWNDHAGALFFVFKQARKTDKTFEEVMTLFDQLPQDKKKKAAQQEQQQLLLLEE